MTLLQGGRRADGARIDVRIDPGTGRVVAVDASVLAERGEEVHDCAGLVILDAPVEPHCHLDKAGTWSVAPNPAADLMGAVRAWSSELQYRDAGAILDTARPALHDLVLHGATAVRTHVNLGTGSGMAPLDAMVALREEAAATGLVELQVVALVSMPYSGDAGAPHRAILDEALGRGADLAGGAPHVDPDPDAGADVALAAAARHGAGVDLHIDETLDPAILGLRHLAAAVTRGGWGPGRVTASHCVSLGMQPPDVQEDVAASVAAAGISVIALPQTNLYLQARGARTASPRGLTAIRPLLDAGVNVAAGGDNVRDPFNAVGRADPVETAALMVMAGHLTPDEAWRSVGNAGRVALGLPEVTLTPGAPAELLALEGTDLVDALARAGERRLVVHGGRVVARTVVRRSLLPTDAPGGPE